MTTAYTYDRTDALIGQNNGVATSFAYDAYGNMTGKAESASTVTTYAYDLGDRLTSITPASGTAATFTFDALGRFKTRTIGATTDTYAYVGASETAYEIASGSTTTDSLVDQTNARDGLKVGAGSAAWFLFDLHGSAVGLENGAKTITDAYRFDGYGETVASYPSSGATANSWRYQGRLDISPNAQAPLYDAGARFYTPSLGTFTQLDTVAGQAQDPASLNRYLYAAANPATLIDPTGHKYCGPDGIKCTGDPSHANDKAYDYDGADVDAIGHQNGHTIYRSTGGHRHLRWHPTVQRDAIGHQNGRTFFTYDQKAPQALARAKAAKVPPNLATAAFRSQHLAEEDQTTSFAWASYSAWNGMTTGERQAYASANGQRAATALANGSAYWSDLAVVSDVALTAGTFAGSDYTGDELQSYAATAQDLGGPNDTLGPLAFLALTLGGAPLVGHDTVGGVAVGPRADEAAAVPSDVGALGADAADYAPIAQLPQDARVDGTAPPALDLSRPVGRSETQNQFVQSRISWLQAQGAREFRVDQQQVDFNGRRVGVNRPDLQYNLGGRRYYEEFGTSISKRGPIHASRIAANHPFGVINLFTVD